MSAWRNGCTPSEMLAMTAIPASTATGRSQPTPVGRLTRSDLPPADCGTRSSRGHGRAATGKASDRGQAQWPRHVQFLARSYAPAATLSSHGRGGRTAILARIRSSPSAPG
jgi:hypothetical protein